MLITKRRALLASVLSFFQPWRGKAHGKRAPAVIEHMGVLVAGGLGKLTIFGSGLDRVTSLSLPKANIVVGVDKIAENELTFGVYLPPNIRSGHLDFDIYTRGGLEYKGSVDVLPAGGMTYSVYPMAPGTPDEDRSQIPNWPGPRVTPCPGWPGHSDLEIYKYYADRIPTKGIGADLI